MNTPLKGACIFGQSGGPSSVINASAYGVIKTALDSEYITKVYGANHGIKGVLEDRLLVMDEEDPKELERLLYTPSSALGPAGIRSPIPMWTTPTTSASWRSSRSTMSATSSTTAATTPWIPATRSPSIWPRSAMTAVSSAVPKTIDNDLFGTDHCPGFASAAKYIATSIMEVLPRLPRL